MIHITCILGNLNELCTESFTISRFEKEEIFTQFLGYEKIIDLIFCILRNCFQRFNLDFHSVFTKSIGQFF
jgi:hypothetical protein